MQLIDEKQKTVIFDSNVYIKLKDRSTIRQRIFSNEKRLNIQSFASPWVVWELAQSRSDIVLDVLKEHCKGDDGQPRLIADPIAQTYYSIYRKKSCKLDNLLVQTLQLLQLDAAQREKPNMKDALKKASDSFVNQFNAFFLSNNLLKNENIIKRKCAEDIIDMCIEINSDEYEVSRIDKAQVVEEFIQKNSAPLEHYYQLLKRKASQENVNKEKLRHDLVDWAILFHASQSNVYVITSENNLLNLNLPNVLNLEKYMKCVLNI